MEILDSSEPFLPWDRNLSELSESADNDNVLYSTVSKSFKMHVAYNVEKFPPDAVITHNSFCECMCDQETKVSQERRDPEELGPWGGSWLLWLQRTKVQTMQERPLSTLIHYSFLQVK